MLQVITGELKQQVDRRLGRLWSGGISNPLEVIEQITYLIFIRRLDDLQTAKENRATRTHQAVENPIYAEDEQQLRWSGSRTSTRTTCWSSSERRVPVAAPTGRRGLDLRPPHAGRPVHDPDVELAHQGRRPHRPHPARRADTKGDVYEYMLGKIATAGRNGQFRTPRHIIRLMVEMMAPGPHDEICDPACGTAGFLMEAAEYVSREHEDALLDLTQREHFNNSMFHGFDFDSTMLRIASMNMLLHEVEQPDIRYRDSLAESAAGEAERYS